MGTLETQEGESRVEEFQKKCPNVSLTLEPLKADYALEAVAEPINLLRGSPTTRHRFTLFSKKRGEDSR